MAMNKKEKAYVEFLEQEIFRLKAEITTYPEVEPDLDPPNPQSAFGVLVKGWLFNTYTRSVYKTCSSVINHGNGWEKTSTQRPIKQFSSEERATIALRNEVVKIYRKELGELDKRIVEIREAKS